MSYQVLARKWRPKNFQQLMGQEHVVSVLENALSQKRLHHAYLFTGTRGVGKTTIARIFAKSLNCELGITDKPCGECPTCIDIDSGNFIDLLEIDAASKTKVDDTREILDNVQYAPTRGRYKVYLIDEVHMLSRHSFNALLKTLEEPPEHVKFILATTDPQKLPITVLSRCLQFHLKALTVAQIEAKLEDILLQEQVSHQDGTLSMLAKAARGSMRDSLSLTDQAIAQGQGHIGLANIQQMLGGIDQNWVYKILIALLKQDGAALITLTQEIASYAPSYSRLFAELIQLLHQIALMQIVEQHFDLPAELLTLLKKFSKALAAEDVQLYYQIAINGRKDLPYAADEQAAFDMTLLRMLAFKPMQATDANVTNKVATENIESLEFDELSIAATNITQGQNLSVGHSLVTEKNQKDTDPAVTNVTQIISASADESALRSDESVDAQSNDIETAHGIENSAADVSLLEEELANVDLAEQMSVIEQQASDLREVNEAQLSPQPQQLQPSIEPTSFQAIDGTNETEESDSSHVQQEDNQETINSPVSAVLATRNMLRSRKKQLEQQAKKSNDAELRQTSEAEQANISESSATQDSQELEAKEILPEPTMSFQQDKIDPAVIKKANQVDKWAHMIDAMELTARIRQLAIHATIGASSTDEHLILQLDQATKHLNTQVAQQQLQDYICQFLSRNIQVTVELVEQTVADPYQIQSHINDKRYDYAKSVLREDAVIIALQQSFQATLDEESICAH